MKSILHSLLISSMIAAFGCQVSPRDESTGSQPNEGATRSGERQVVVATEPTREELIKQGEHIVTTSGCHDCHTPFKMGTNGPEPDMSRQLSGHPQAMLLPPPPAPVGPWVMAVAATNTAWSGPWGVSFTANLTPDDETGLGKWTSETFIQTIRTGRHMGRGRPILPPMPVPVYQNFSDQELASIFAYLQSLPPQRNRVPDPLPPAEPPKAPQG